jgi:hypothetical protein
MVSYSLVVRERPQLTVIQGDNIQPQGWLDVPATAIGRSWTGSSSIRSYRIAQGDARKAITRGLRQPILNLWSLVLGEVPPVPQFERYAHLLPQLKAGAFSSAHACFRGVKRPVGEDDNGYDTIIFVTKPSVMFGYDPSLACVIKPIEIPSDMLFVTYARLDYPDQPLRNLRTGNGPTDGIITHWGMVEAGRGDAGLLPIDFKERYRRQLW